MCTHTVARGLGGMLPRKENDRNGVIWCDLGVPMYVITNLKTNNFKEKNQQENLIVIFLSQTDRDEHVSMKINTCRIYKGGLGGIPPESKEF